MKKEWMTKTIVVWIGALICSALWGSAFPGIKIGYRWMQIATEDTATQILYAGYRFTIAGVLAVLLGSLIQRKPLLPSKRSVPRVMLLSLFQTILQYAFFYVGLAHTDGTKASIIEGMNVFVAIFVSGVIFHLEKVTSRKIIGSIIGFCGVVLVNLSGTSLNLSLTLWGEGFIFFSTVAYAFSTVLLKRYSVEENTVLLSGWQFIFGGLVMTAAGFFMGGRIETVTTAGIAMLLYLAMVSAVAYSLWSILLTYNPVSKVAVFGFMNPVIGFLLSAILLKESEALNLTAVVSLGLVCLGIYIVNHAKQAAESTKE